MTPTCSAVPGAYWGGNSCECPASYIGAYPNCILPSAISLTVQATANPNTVADNGGLSGQGCAPQSGCTSINFSVTSNYALDTFRCVDSNGNAIYPGFAVSISPFSQSQDGTQTYTVTCVDSEGLSASGTASFDVQPAAAVVPPVPDTFSCVAYTDPSTNNTEALCTYSSSTNGDACYIYEVSPNTGGPWGGSQSVTNVAVPLPPSGATYRRMHGECGRYCGAAVKLILLLGLLSILDGVLTWTEIPHGITEVNPVMAAVLPFGLLGVVAVKGIPVGCLGLLARNRESGGNRCKGTDRSVWPSDLLSRRGAHGDRVNFSLIGLLVTMCVAAILATNALPSQQMAIERTQVKHAIQDLQFIRSDLSAYLVACDLNPNALSNGLSSLPHYAVPTTCVSGLPISSQGGAVGGMVSQASLNGLVLTATLGGQVMAGLKGQQIVLTAKVIGSAVSWSCAGPMGVIAPSC